MPYIYLRLFFLGWPIAHSLDEKVSKHFNQCLDESFNYLKAHKATSSTRKQITQSSQQQQQDINQTGVDVEFPTRQSRRGQKRTKSRNRMIKHKDVTNVGIDDALLPIQGQSRRPEMHLHSNVRTSNRIRTRLSENNHSSDKVRHDAPLQLILNDKIFDMRNVKLQYNLPDGYGNIRSHEGHGIQIPQSQASIRSHSNGRSKQRNSSANNETPLLSSEVQLPNETPATIADENQRHLTSDSSPSKESDHAEKETAPSSEIIVQTTDVGSEAKIVENNSTVQSEVQILEVEDEPSPDKRARKKQKSSDFSVTWNPSDDSKRESRVRSTETLKTNLDPSTSSFGELFDDVCSERYGYNSQATNKSTTSPATSSYFSSFHKSTLWRWHQANLELSCGASFNELGWEWNEDEMFGYDGDHVAIPESWSSVIEPLAQPLNILYNEPISKLKIVSSNINDSSRNDEHKSKPTETLKKSGDRTASNTQNGETNPRPLVVELSLGSCDTINNNLPVSSRVISPTKHTDDNSQKQKNVRKQSVAKPKIAQSQKSIRRKTYEESMLTPLPSIRRSRRILGEHANVRRSERANKGSGIDLFTVDHTQEQSQRRERKEIVDSDSKVDFNGNRSVVHVTLANSGKVLQADAVICTLPLAILKNSIKATKNSATSPVNGRKGNGERSNTGPIVTFDPPLPLSKQVAIEQLGAGYYNKCVISFPFQFWQGDSDFLGLAASVRPYLIVNGSVYNNGNPILIFLFGGSMAKDMEEWSDMDVMYDCMIALKRICGKTSIPDPVDYHCTRWGHEKFSQMAFTYIPVGVHGFQALQAMSKAIYNDNSTIPILMFAGEHTTPYVSLIL